MILVFFFADTGTSSGSDVIHIILFVQECLSHSRESGLKWVHYPAL